MVYYDVIAFLPLYILIESFTKNTYYSRLFFTILVSGYSVNEIVNKRYYTLEALNNIEEYNSVAEKCILMCMLYFSYDFFNKEIYNNNGFIIHNAICLCSGLTILYYKFYGILSLYLCCHEISTIFLNLKHLNICKDFSDKMFIVTFLGIRGTTLPIMVFKTYSKNKYLCFIILIDCGLHIFWISQKIGNIRKKAKTKAKAKATLNNNDEYLKLNIIEYGEKND
jgi:hypothetical protein